MTTLTATYLHLLQLLHTSTELHATMSIHR